MLQSITTTKSSALTINFVCNPSRTDRYGLSTIHAVISVGGNRTNIALPRKEAPTAFKTAMKSKRNNETKVFCDTIRGQLQTYVIQIISAGQQLTAAKLKSAYLNGFSTSYTLLMAITEYMGTLEYTMELYNYRKYELAFKMLTTVIDEKTEIKDILPSQITVLKAQIEKKYTQGTAAGYLTRIKSLFLYLLNNRKIDTNPFNGIKIGKPKTKLEIISDADYEAIKNKSFEIERIEKVRKLFVIQCNCGLAYTDLSQLTKEDFTERDGQITINKKRQKTSVEYMSIVLPDAIEILKEIEFDIKRLLISNVKYNAYLKEIQDACGIKLNLHTHMARHYYVTKLIKMGVPISIVAQTVGHSSTKMTENYINLSKDDIVSGVAAHI